MKLSLSLFCLVAIAFSYGESAEPDPPCNLACTLEINPVCGSDFMTYPNQCALDFADCVSKQVLNKRIVKYYDGDCPTGMQPSILTMLRGGSDSSCSHACTFEYRPVCGTDGKTYPNVCAYQAAACEAKKDGLHILIAKHGQCVTDCIQPCTVDYTPVCGSNGITYPNQCGLEVASCISVASGLDKITYKNNGMCTIDSA